MPRPRRSAGSRVVRLEYTPTPKQALLHNSTARQILFGGSAGSGKSRALRWDAVMFCLAIAGLEAYLFRKSHPELLNNHIRALQRELPLEVAEYNVSQGLFTFHNGSKLVCAHCEGPTDHLRYQGSEMHLLLIDEAALLLPNQIIELRARVRLGDFAPKIPPEYRPYLPRMVLASNPGGPSHSWIKEQFISPAPPYTIFKDKVLGWDTIYLPARLSDNPHMESEYGAAFSAMSPERRKALLEGDWDQVEGSALHLLQRTRHCVKSFPIPQHWTKIMGIDWGTASPTSIGWYAVVGEPTTVKNNDHLEVTPENPTRTVYLPVGAIVRFQELYLYSGEPNKGLQLDSVTVAKMILDREREDKENLCTITYRVGDSAMWNRVDGPSVAERMFVATAGRVTLTRCKKDRLSNHDELNCRLAGNPFLQEDGTIHNDPMFFCAANCVHFWRTLPILTLDPLHPEKGPAENSENHVYDEVCYVLASRPMITSRQMAEHDELMEARRAVKQTSVDAYSTH